MSFFSRSRVAVLPAVFFTIGLAAFAACPASAQIVFDNGTPNNVAAFYSGTIFNQYLADTFTFGSTTSFNTVTWFGSYLDGRTPTDSDAFTLSFHDTYNGVQGTTINGAARPGQTFDIGNNVTRTLTGDTLVLGNNRYAGYRYTVVLPSSLTFGAGTYGMSIVNNASTPTNDAWAWAVSTLPGTFNLRRQTTDDFTPAAGNNNLAFNLSNTAVAAPEPGSIALLLAAGVPVVGIVRRRAKNRI